MCPTIDVAFEKALTVSIHVAYSFGSVCISRTEAKARTIPQGPVTMNRIDYALCHTPCSWSVRGL